MKHFIQKLTVGAILGAALLVGGAATAQATMFNIDFSSGNTFGPNTPFGPKGYTEDHMTVESFDTTNPHIHLANVGNPGTALTIHDGCCSTPYVFSFTAPVNIISIDWKWGGNSLADHTFETDAIGGVQAFLPFVTSWTTFNVQGGPTASTFSGITSITLNMYNGNLKLDNLKYELVNTQQPVPEPSTMLLLGSGLVGIVAWRYRKHQA